MEIGMSISDGCITAYKVHLRLMLVDHTGFNFQQFPSVTCYNFSLQQAVSAFFMWGRFSYNCLERDHSLKTAITLYC